MKRNCESESNLLRNIIRYSEYIPIFRISISNYPGNDEN